ncbi:hypothetical protein DFJ73DRAFT_922128 [Zopfochytrium polystomum]|nr:hypothetical protein DFJ73DRAFT_922128 [Zopfochytrium polystomum]
MLRHPFPTDDSRIPSAAALATLPVIQRLHSSRRDGTKQPQRGGGSGEGRGGRGGGKADHRPHAPDRGVEGGGGIGDDAPHKADLDRVIRELAEVDLAADEVAFREWVAKKRQCRRRAWDPAAVARDPPVTITGHGEELHAKVAKAKSLEEQNGGGHWASPVREAVDDPLFAPESRSSTLEDGPGSVMADVPPPLPVHSEPPAPTPPPLPQAYERPHVTFAPPRPHRPPQPQLVKPVTGGGYVPMIPAGGGRAVPVTQLEHMDAAAVDALITARVRSQRAYAAWLEAKREAARAQREREREAAEAAARKAAEAAARQREKRARVRRALVEWARSKEAAEEARLAREEAERGRKESVRRRKAEAGEAAFREWAAAVERRREAGLLRAYPHTRPWVGVVSQDGDDYYEGEGTNGQSTAFRCKLGDDSDSGVVPSPPNMFQEYTTYQKLVPEYVRKYPYQVATAGRKDISAAALESVRTPLGHNQARKGAVGTASAPSKRHHHPQHQRHQHREQRPWR